MNRRIAVLALPLCLTACGGGGDESRDHEDAGPAKPAPQLTVDLYGDSIGAGYAVEVTPAERIALIRPTWGVMDYSVYGLRLSELMEVFPTIPRTAQFVALALGFNDANEEDPHFETNLRTAIEIVIREGRTPVISGLVGVHAPTPLMVRYNAVTHRLADEYGLEHAGWGESFQPGDVNPDGIHRTQEASDRLAALLASAIERAAQKKIARGGVAQR